MGGRRCDVHLPIGVADLALTLSELPSVLHAPERDGYPSTTTWERLLPEIRISNRCWYKHILLKLLVWVG